MQFDMFGDSPEPVSHESSAPMLASSDAWMPPEAAVFNAALRRGSLPDAAAILKPLGLDALKMVLLSSGFGVPASGNRKALLFLVQGDIVAAAQNRMTGSELLASRRAEKEKEDLAAGGTGVPFVAEDYAIAFLPPVTVGDFITHSDGFNYVVTSLTGGRDNYLKDGFSVEAIRPKESKIVDSDLPGMIPYSSFAQQVVKLTPRMAKVAKQRYVVERDNAIKIDSPSLATANFYSGFVRDNTELSDTLGNVIRHYDSIYQIDKLVGNAAPYSEVHVSRTVDMGDAPHIKESLVLSHGEARNAQRALYPEVVSFDIELAKAHSLGIEGRLPAPVDLTSLDGPGALKMGDILVDEQGKKYAAFSTRFGYLEVHPCDQQGKPVIFSGNSVFFHLHPETAYAYPDRRHDPLYRLDGIALDKSNELMHITPMEDAEITASEKEKNNDAGIDGSESIRAGTGTEDREDGIDSSGRGESLDSGVAQSGGGVVEDRLVSAVPGGPGESGEGHSGGRTEHEAFVESGNSAVARSERSAADSGRTGNKIEHDAKRTYTVAELNALLVTDMSDDQLLQAKVLFAGHRRFVSIERQIQKRGLDPQPAAALASVSVGDAEKQTVNLPTAISEAIAADMSKQKRTYLQLQSAAKRSVESLDLRLLLQEKVREASVALRNMRLSVFAVEDAVVLAIGAGQTHFLDQHAALFPQTLSYVSAHIASLKYELPDVSVSQDKNASGWDALSAQEKTGVLSRAGWITNEGDLNFVGKRLLETPWEKIIPGTQSTILKNMPQVALDGQQVPAADPMHSVASSGLESAATSSSRQFRDTKTLNALVNPILDGDWFKLSNGEEWQARNGYSGRGWSLVKDKNLHPLARNFEAQSAFMGAVIDVVERVQEPVVEPVPVASVSEVQAQAPAVAKTAVGLRSVMGNDARNFRDLDSISVVDSPLLDGDWLSIDGKEWQARHNDSSLGWSLFSDGIYSPPEFKGIASQADFMLSVLSFAGKDIGMPTVAPVALPRDSDVQLQAAGRLLSQLTRGRGDIYALAGPSNVQSRVQVMAMLLGRDKVPQAEAGVTAIRDEFYKRAGINFAGTTPRGAEVEFGNWIEGLAKADAEIAGRAKAAPTEAVAPAAPATASLAESLGQGTATGSVAQDTDSFVSSGLKINVRNVNMGGEALSRWIVQSPENAEREARGERQIGGDLITGSRDEAVERAQFEANSHAQRKANMADLDQQAQEHQQEVDAKKEANRGKSLSERRADAFLDGRTTLPPSMSLGAGTKRESMQRAVEDGRAIVAVQVPDTAAKKRDNDVMDTVRRSGYILGLSNENLPLVKAGLEASARLKANDYFKPEYRVYVGADTNSAFREISKTEFDYAQGLIAAKQLAESSAQVGDAAPAAASLAGEGVESASVATLDAGAKEPWMMNHSEFGQQRGGNPFFDQSYPGQGDAPYLRDVQALHAQLVKQAVADGKAVPQSILDDYPGLMPAAAGVSVPPIASLGAPEAVAKAPEAIDLADFWKHLSPEAKKDVLMQSGFVNSRDELSFVGTRLAGEPWKRVALHARVVDGLGAYAKNLSADVDAPSAVAAAVDTSFAVPSDAAALASVAVAEASTGVVPDSTRNRVQWAIDRMTDVQRALAGVERARGDGAILAAEWADQSPNLVRAREILGNFKELAVKNGVDADAFLRSLGGVPDFSRFEARDAVRAAAAQAVQSVAPDAGVESVERNEYPFGNTVDHTDSDRFLGSRVRVSPNLQGDVAWEGEVSSVLNGGRLVTVKRAVDGGRDYLPVRIGGDRIEVLELKDRQAGVEVAAVNDGAQAQVLASVNEPANAVAALAAGVVAQSQDVNSLVALYEVRLKKVKEMWLTGDKEGSFQSERGQEYVQYAQDLLDAVKSEVARVVQSAGREDGVVPSASVAAAVPMASLDVAAEAEMESGVVSDSGWSVENHVLITADSVAALRAGDVLRLFEELPKDVDRFDDLRVHIVENRPDLLSAVVDAMDEVGVPARKPQFSISAADQATRVASMHAKATILKEFLAQGDGSVDLATRLRVTTLSSPDQIRLKSDGVYVPEGRDSNAADGLRWVFVLDSQLDSLLAQVPPELLAGLEKAGTAALGESLDGDGVLASVADQGAQLVTPGEADFSITDGDRIGKGGLGEKYRDNLRAIQILRAMAAEDRQADENEKRALARYVGWGGLKGVFDPNNKQWARQHVELRGLLTDAEWAAASRSQLDAHYTAPVVVDAMYSALGRLGFEQGRVLEPSVGVGNFFGMMPNAMRSESELHGVELDILTSQIVSALYPSAKISKATGFEEYNVPAGYFDVVIGNPPFGSHSLTDQNGSAFSGWSIHNYFFAKSIEMLRPGGVMPMVVSHNFLDKLDPHVRQWIARRAELVSGVRLPNTAFKENANTEVVTDVLIFKRLDFENSLGKQEMPDWLGTTEVPIKNQKTGDVENLSVNNYFLNNPQNVLGESSAMGSMYRANEYTVLPTGDLQEQLASWVESLPVGIYEAVSRSVADVAPAAAVNVPEYVKEGSFFLEGAEVWQRMSDFGGEHRAEKWEAPNQRALERMTGMIEIREALRSQMRLEQSERGVSDEMIAQGRQNLNLAYDTFQKKNGYLNDPINRRIFLDDTESALIQALEFDYEKPINAAKAEEFGIEQRPSTAVKADIFSSRVLFPPGKIEVVHTAKDALLHSLNQKGRVDMEYMRSAYPKTTQEIVAELGELIFTDPVEGYVTADFYLSGDVKTKLSEATKALENGMSDSTLLSRNIEALKKVIPADKLPSEIHAALGAAWIPETIYNEFSREISGGDVNFSYVPPTGQWLAHKINQADTVKNSVEFGTIDIGAMQILNLLMNSRAPEIKEKIDGKYVTNQPATEAARQKADKIRAHWDSWLWSDMDRSVQLASIFNEKFNRTVERKNDGSHLTLPGMSPHITLLDHQKNGVWRGLQDRTMLLDQVVGAGKTYEGVAMLMEMRRLGITKKPLIAVPNHLTLQWRSDFYKLYPGANVLAATPQDFEKENRERFFSKVVTGNWDAVIVGHSSLKKIPVPQKAELKIINEQFEDISNAIQDLKSQRGDRSVIKDMEVIKANLEAKMARLKEKGGKKDNVVDFADLGVDALFVDEMHEFKNLFFTTQMNRVSGLGNPAGSGKAFDLFVKIRWMQDTYGLDAPLITATGTPVSNSLAEMFTMQRFMQYDKLKANGLHVFDAWAKQYGDVQNVYEVAPSGSGYRLSQRFAKFKNLASLMGEYRSFADVITLDDLKAQEIALGKTFPVPKLVGGKPNNIVAERSELQEKFFGIPELDRNDADQITFQIGLDAKIKIEETDKKKFVLKRAFVPYGKTEEEYQQFGSEYETQEEAAYALALGAVTPAMKIDPESIVGQFENLSRLVKESEGKINALSLTSLANKAGLDYRLIDPGAIDFPDSKVNKAVERIVALGQKWEEQKGTQLIFCDLSVPLSAKAKMAAKEKRVYVRDDVGNVTHKSGTLHTVKDRAIAYYVVAEGKAKSKTFTIYDATTGHVMKNGLDSKMDAHGFVKDIFSKEDGTDRWLATRENSRSIEPDEIDEYKNEKSIDVDGDAADLEISLHDVEGVSGPAAFSIYDDMKAKLIARGVPPAQIAFIHDYDTPQSKAMLFKRVNDGDVRYLFGSTPKMGAGTNVQKLLVGLHHIDAPWRPSDLEQREGRIIRRGNMLYENDPVNFEVAVDRYATSQTYDTRRWQLLEHKANGLEQLRNYTGANEIDDVTTEAANSADMKAAASGNPLILKETQLSNQVKKFSLLERAHRDSEFLLNSKVRGERNYAENYGPAKLAKFLEVKEKMTDGEVLAIYAEKPLHTKEELMEAMNAIGKSLQAANGLKVINFKGLDFGFQFHHDSQYAEMTSPIGGKHKMDSFSPSGAATRMENWCEKVDIEISQIKNQIAYSREVADNVQRTLGKPFEHADDLVAAIEEHGKVQRALMKSNATAAVKPAEMAEFQAAVAAQKEKLRAYGFGAAVDELENMDGVEVEAVPAQAAAPALKSVADVGVEAGGESAPAMLDGSAAAVQVQDMGQFIKVAADSIADLRKVDVYRVLVESNKVENQEAIAAFIKAQRHDLVAEVDDVMQEARVERQGAAVGAVPGGDGPTVAAVASLAASQVDVGGDAVASQGTVDAKSPDWTDAAEVLRKTRAYAPQRIYPNDTPVLTLIQSGWNNVGTQVMLEAKRLELAKALGVEVEKCRDPGSISMKLRVVSAPAAVMSATLGSIVDWQHLPKVQPQAAALPVAETLPEPLRVSPYVPGIEGAKAKMVEKIPVLKMPSGWVAMYGQRPLLGDRSTGGEGRHFSILDPAAPMTPAFVEQNIRWGAMVLIEVDKDAQEKVSADLGEGAAIGTVLYSDLSRAVAQAKGIVLPSLADVAVEPVDADIAQAAEMTPEVTLGFEDVKTRMVESFSFDVPSGWVVMNAPRPLLGQQMVEGDFVAGRHYALLDPADSMTSAYIKENVKLDARVVVAVPRDVQMEVALQGNEYRDRYMEMEPEKRFERLSSSLRNLHDMRYSDLSKAVLATKEVALDGAHFGEVLSVTAGAVAQRVDRMGKTMHHDAAKLSGPVKVGDVVEIAYQGGRGVVSGPDRAHAVGR